MLVIGCFSVSSVQCLPAGQAGSMFEMFESSNSAYWYNYQDNYSSRVSTA